MINFTNVLPEYAEQINIIYDATLKYFGQAEDIFEIELMAVDSDYIHQVNIEEREVDRPTDVLSFQNIENLTLPAKLDDFDFFDINIESQKVILGDILICLNIMEEQAKVYGHSFKREMAYLSLHGILHLLGFDHMTEDDKKIMRKHEEAILNSLNIVR